MKYIIEVTIEDGNDEFWDEIRSSEKTGCDEVVEAVKMSLGNSGFFVDDGQVRLKTFINDDPLENKPRRK